MFFFIAVCGSAVLSRYSHARTCYSVRPWLIFFVTIVPPTFAPYRVLIPREQRWMMVPLDHNNNDDQVDVKPLRPEIPIKSLASAFACMGHMKIADTLVAEMVPFIGVDAKSQWIGLEKMLLEMKLNSILSGVGKDCQSTNLKLKI